MKDVLMETWAELTAEGAPFAWSETEVRGMTMRTFDAAPPNMRLLWEMSAGHGDASYLVYEDETYTYNEAHAIVRSLAGVLHDDHGVRAGDRVAIAMRNFPEWVFSYWAISSLGAAVVGMNAWWTSREMSFGLNDSRPKVLICDDERLERVTSELAELREAGSMHVISVRTDRELPDDASRWEDVVDPANAPEALPAAEIDPDDDMCIFYTSGTTGFPKGAQLTHRGCIHNLLHMAFAMTAADMAGAKLLAAAGEAPAAGDAAAAPAPPTIMVPTPLFHVTANNCVLHPGTAVGGTVVLLRKWDPARALELIERERVTNFTGVPTMSREMLMHPDWETRDTSSLESLGGGGAALQPDLVEKIDNAGENVKPSTGYGLTETHGIVTAIAAAFFTAEPASAGPIMPTFQHKVLDEDGNEVGPGGFGELVVQGPAVVKGYLNRPDATEESMPEGWFRTGDIVTVDEHGFVFIVDRAKDMVIRGGENIYCSEVESAIYEHPDVAECAVFGLEDERLGEKVAVAIYRTPDSTMDEAGLSAHLTDRIAKFKHPEAVFFVSEPLPQNANGKFVKRQLRESLA